MSISNFSSTLNTIPLESIYEKPELSDNISTVNPLLQQDCNQQDPIKVEPVLTSDLAHIPPKAIQSSETHIQSPQVETSAKSDKIDDHSPFENQIQQVQQEFKNTSNIPPQLSTTDNEVSNDVIIKEAPDSIENQKEKSLLLQDGKQDVNPTDGYLHDAKNKPLSSNQEQDQNMIPKTSLADTVQQPVPSSQEPRIESSGRIQISINLNELVEGSASKDFQKQNIQIRPIVNAVNSSQKTQHDAVVNNDQTQHQGRNRPQRENRKRPSHFGFNQCHQCKRTESIDDLIRCKKENCLLNFCYSCIRKDKLKKAPEYPQHLVFPKTDFYRLKEAKNFSCLSCKGQCQCKDCNQNSLFSDIQKLQQDIQEGAQNQNLNDNQSIWVTAPQSQQSSKVILQLQSNKSPMLQKTQLKTTSPFQSKPNDSDNKVQAPNVNQYQTQKQNIFVNIKVDRQAQSAQTKAKEATPAPINRNLNKILSKQGESHQRMERESKIQAKLATKQMIEKEEKDQELPKQPKVVVTSSGRVAKRRKPAEYYQEEYGEEDELEEEEDDEDSSEYGEKKKDADYTVDSDLEYDSDCLNYDNLKRNLLKTPGVIDITSDKIFIDRHKDDGQILYPKQGLLGQNNHGLNQMQNMSQSFMNGLMNNQAMNQNILAQNQMQLSGGMFNEQHLNQLQNQNALLNEDLQNKYKDLMMMQNHLTNMNDPVAQAQQLQTLQALAQAQASPYMFPPQLMPQYQQQMMAMDPYYQMMLMQPQMMPQGMDLQALYAQQLYGNYGGLPYQSMNQLGAQNQGYGLQQQLEEQKSKGAVSSNSPTLNFPSMPQTMTQLNPQTIRSPSPYLQDPSQAMNAQIFEQMQSNLNQNIRNLQQNLETNPSSANDHQQQMMLMNQNQQMEALAQQLSQLHPGVPLNELFKAYGIDSSQQQQYGQADLNAMFQNQYMAQQQQQQEANYQNDQQLQKMMQMLNSQNNGQQMQYYQQ